MLQFKLPAAHSVRIPAEEAQGFTPLRPPRAFCHIRLHLTTWWPTPGRQVLATWAWWVVPFGLSLIGPGMSLDIRLLVGSDETPSSDGSESMAVCLSDPVG